MSTGRRGLLPRAIVVLTFKDQVTEAQLVKMENELQEAVRGTEAFEKDVVVFATKTRLCHRINNLSPDKADVMDIRKTIQRIGSQNKEYRISTPYTWMYFGIALRELEDKVLSYKDCLLLGKECGIKEEEFDKALAFLHNVGVIRHFSEVEELRDIVIKEPQLLFDNVSELVINTFTFENVGVSDIEEFEKKGIFCARVIDRLPTNSELLTPSKFLAFLKHHNVIAPLEEEGVVTKYFLPCSLVHADIAQESSPSDSCMPPLLIIFDSGYTPRGLFGFLVTDLLQATPEDEIQIELDQDRIYRNQVTLTVGPFADKFRFSFCPSYVRVDVFPCSGDRNVPIGEICDFVRERVSSSLSKVVRKLNYNFQARHSLAFPCPDASGGVHPAKVTFFQGEPSTMKCTLSKEVKDLSNGHRVWFNKAASLQEVSDVVPKPESGSTWWSQLLKPLFVVSMLIFSLLLMWMLVNSSQLPIGNTGSVFPAQQSHPVDSLKDLNQMLQDVGDWEGLCLNLDVPDSVRNGLRFSNESPEVKKQRCLEAFINGEDPTWETVIEAVRSFPIHNRKLAKTIANKFQTHPKHDL